MKNLFAATTFALAVISPFTTAQEKSGLDPALREEIRDIVRKEVRTALRDALGKPTPIAAALEDVTEGGVVEKLAKAKKKIAATKLHTMTGEGMPFVWHGTSGGGGEAVFVTPHPPAGGDHHVTWMGETSDSGEGNVHVIINGKPIKLDLKKAGNVMKLEDVLMKIEGLGDIGGLAEMKAVIDGAKKNAKKSAKKNAKQSKNVKLRVLVDDSGEECVECEVEGSEDGEDAECCEECETECCEETEAAESKAKSIAEILHSVEVKGEDGAVVVRSGKDGAKAKVFRVETKAVDTGSATDEPVKAIKLKKID